MLAQENLILVYKNPYAADLISGIIAVEVGQGILFCAGSVAKVWEVSIG